MAGGSGKFASNVNNLPVFGTMFGKSFMSQMLPPTAHRKHMHLLANKLELEVSI